MKFWLIFRASPKLSVFCQPAGCSPKLEAIFYQFLITEKETEIFLRSYLCVITVSCISSFKTDQSETNDVIFDQSERGMVICLNLHHHARIITVIRVTNRSDAPFFIRTHFLRTETEIPLENWRINWEFIEKMLRRQTAGFVAIILLNIMPRIFWEYSRLILL